MGRQTTGEAILVHADADLVDQTTDHRRRAQEHENVEDDAPPDEPGDPEIRLEHRCDMLRRPPLLDHHRLHLLAQLGETWIVRRQGLAEVPSILQPDGEDAVAAVRDWERKRHEPLRSLIVPEPDVPDFLFSERARIIGRNHNDAIARFTLDQIGEEARNSPNAHVHRQTEKDAQKGERQADDDRPDDASPGRDPGRRIDEIGRTLRHSGRIVATRIGARRQPRGRAARRSAQSIDDDNRRRGRNRPWALAPSLPGGARENRRLP